MSGTPRSRPTGSSSSHLLDELLDLLERDDTYARFLLDGQTAVLDDYLEVRPAAEARLAALIAAGRVQIGPWMVLMDEYMVSARDDGARPPARHRAGHARSAER